MPNQLRVMLGEHLIDVPVCYDAQQCTKIEARWSQGVVRLDQMFEREGEPFEAKRSLYRMAESIARKLGLELPSRPAKFNHEGRDPLRPLMSLSAVSSPAAPKPAPRPMRIT